MKSGVVKTQKLDKDSKRLWSAMRTVNWEGFDDSPSLLTVNCVCSNKPLDIAA